MARYYYTDRDFRIHATTFHTRTSGKQNPPINRSSCTLRLHRRPLAMHARETRHREITKGRYDARIRCDPRGRGALSRHDRLGVIIPAESNRELARSSNHGKKKQHWEWEKRHMESMPRWSDSMDQGHRGKIVQTLQSPAANSENTLICFLQTDNGGCAEGLGGVENDGSRAVRPRPANPLPTITLHLDMIPRSKTRERVSSVRKGKQAFAVPADTYARLRPKAWATVLQYPVSWNTNTGTPTKAALHTDDRHWPAGMTRRGELESTPGHLIDLMATGVDCRLRSNPERFMANNRIHPLERQESPRRSSSANRSIGGESIGKPRRANRARPGR